MYIVERYNFYILNNNDTATIQKEYHHEKYFWISFLKD